MLDYSRSPDTTNSPAIDAVFGSTAITAEDGTSNWGFYWSSTTHKELSSSDDTYAGNYASYVAFGEALGWIEASTDNWELRDVHGAGAQRSDPKSGDPDDYPHGLGPQGDVIRIYNPVRPVRDDI